jgi:hypothetical protein
VIIEKFGNSFFIPEDLNEIQALGYTNVADREATSDDLQAEIRGLLRLLRDREAALEQAQKRGDDYREKIVERDVELARLKAKPPRRGNGGADYDGEPDGEYDDQQDREAHHGFHFLSVDELLADPKPLAFAIPGLIPDNAISFLVGDFGTCKTVLAIDWALCMALGKPWRGKPVKQGPVFFILGEGHDGFANRVRAWCAYHQVDPSELKGKLFVSNAPGDLVDPEAARQVMKSIEAAGVGAPAGIVVDTLARNFGSSDENSTRDSNIFYNNVDAYLRRPFGAAVLIQHHIGHLERDRPKGARQLIHNADASYLITASDDYIELSCKKAKEFSKPEPIGFKRRVVELGFQDAEGQEVTSVVLDSTERDGSVNTNVNTSVNTGKTEEKMLAVLEELFDTAKENREAGGYCPDGARVSIQDWRETLVNRGVCKTRQHFYGAKNRLRDKRLIEIESGFVKPAERKH